MALNPIPVGDAIAAFIQANGPGSGSPVTEDQLKVIWEGIVTIIYDDLKANLGVLAGSFVVAGVTAGPNTIPITGLGGPAE